MINICLLLKLTVEDYINHITGERLFRLDPGFAEQQSWYRTNWIALEFDLLYRWHGLVPDELIVNGAPVEAALYRWNNELLEETGVGSIISNASSQAAGRISLGNNPFFLMESEYQTIKMGRDFRLQSYNAYRESFGLKRLRSFSELTSNSVLARQLEALYGDIDRLELVIGLFAEDAQPGALFGSLLLTMVSYDAFTQIYTNPLLSKNIHTADSLTPYGLELIQTTNSIEALVRRNLPAGSPSLARLGV
jgi:prostaglandin-endoperoxide synthase 2